MCYGSCNPIDKRFATNGTSCLSKYGLTAQLLLRTSDVKQSSELLPYIYIYIYIHTHTYTYFPQFNHFQDT
jgi:hypothetical protein